MEEDDESDDDNSTVQEMYHDLNEVLEYEEETQDLDAAWFIHNNLESHVDFMRDEYGQGDLRESNLDIRITKFDAKFYSTRNKLNDLAYTFPPDSIEEVYYLALEHAMMHYENHLRSFMTSLRVLGDLKSYDIYHNREKSDLPDELMRIVNEYSYSPPILDIYEKFKERFDYAHYDNEQDHFITLDKLTIPNSIYRHIIFGYQKENTHYTLAPIEGTRIGFNDALLVFNGLAPEESLESHKLYSPNSFIYYG